MSKKLLLHRSVPSIASLVSYENPYKIKATEQSLTHSSPQRQMQLRYPLLL